MNKVRKIQLSALAVLVSGVSVLTLEPSSALASQCMPEVFCVTPTQCTNAKGFCLAHLPMGCVLIPPVCPFGTGCPTGYDKLTCNYTT
jgi:hypothetical protein